jgi:hypothetical protein
VGVSQILQLKIKSAFRAKIESVSLPEHHHKINGSFSRKRGFSSMKYLEMVRGAGFDGNLAGFPLFGA